MKEEKRVLSQETLTDVTGGDGSNMCPFNKSFPLKACKFLDCPYCNGTYCNVYKNDIDTPHEIIV